MSSQAEQQAAGPGSIPSSALARTEVELQGCRCCEGLLPAAAWPPDTGRPRGPAGSEQLSKNGVQSWCFEGLLLPLAKTKSLAWPGLLQPLVNIHPRMCHTPFLSLGVPCHSSYWCAFPSPLSWSRLFDSDSWEPSLTSPNRVISFFVFSF